jgi:hypothetical protein
MHLIVHLFNNERLLCVAFSHFSQGRNLHFLLLFSFLAVNLNTLNPSFKIATAHVIDKFRDRNLNAKTFRSNILLFVHMIMNVSTFFWSFFPP